jgi:cyclopropane fatty-acyl-phospholipid synthase-like methyltransferase
MTQATLQFETASGYELLSAAGKTVLRPGGRKATEQLLDWANFTPGETVLELASGVGTSAIALAKQYNVTVTGIEKNPTHVAIAQARVKAAGLEGQVWIRQGDIFTLESITRQFDYVLAEAILTMQSPMGKAKILQAVSDRLKPGGKFLSHEVAVHHRETELHHVLSEIVRVNVTPLSPSGWITTLKDAGLKVDHQHVGRMHLLNPTAVIEDEGWANALWMGLNIALRPKMRSRIVAMYQTFQHHQHDLNYIILVSMKKRQ